MRILVPNKAAMLLPTDHLFVTRACGCAGANGEVLVKDSVLFAL